ncbi:MAG: hypothetical protein HYS57_03265 [Parcubacteria group bacterium]|nr:hypothetical protein [Parcubacteria group bacterium]
MVRLVVRRPGPEGRFEKQWLWIPEQRRLENLIHGAAIQVFDAVDEVTGEVMHEGIALESRRAELHVVVREEDQHFGFVFHRRLSVIPPVVSVRLFSEDPNRILSVFDWAAGIEEYEASHGLARNRLEEVLQEMGLAVHDSVHIGAIKDTPPIGGIAHELFAVKVGRESSGQAPERGEEISHVRFFPPEEVKGIQTICGLTQSSLWRFRSWGLSQPRDSFWYSAASRL